MGVMAYQAGMQACAMIAGLQQLELKGRHLESFARASVQSQFVSTDHAGYSHS